MKCPKDGAELAGVRVGSIKLEKCHKCDGLWFDRGELEAIRAAKLTEIEETLESQYGDPEYTLREVDGYMRCPKCGGALQRVYDTHRTAIEIDRCSECSGVWLDDGELDKVTGRRRTGQQTAESGRAKTILRSMLSWFETS